MASIVKRGDHFYVVYLYTDGTGKRKQKWEPYKTQPEAKTRQKEIEYKEQIGTFVIPQCNTLDDLLKEYNVIHICGKDKTDASLEGKPGYRQFEYVKKELPDMFALADLVISRAGANAICELHALRKPNILIPLPLKQSRGDQILNAESFERSGYSKVIQEENIEDNTILNAVHEVFKNKDKYIEAMSRDFDADSITLITDIIDSLVEK